VGALPACARPGPDQSTSGCCASAATEALQRAGLAVVQLSGHDEAPVDATERECWELRRRELYVGMTRARDGLWVGVV